MNGVQDMCGIVGYTGRQEATPIILDGLKKLEYRGYDSAGICTIAAGQAAIRRSEGKLVNLERLITDQPLSGAIGIGHTRWATHGRPSEINAHPHQAGSVIVVHNGIIENYLAAAGKQLKAQGHTFKSETDTEVISHLIEEKLKTTGDFEQAVRLALAELRGAYAVCVLCEREPGTLIAAKLGSPMVVGLGDGEFFVASDIPAILAHTREMVFLEDGEMAVCQGRRDSLLHRCRSAARQNAPPHRLVSPHGGKGGVPALHAQGDLRAAAGRPGHHRREARRGDRRRLPGRPEACRRGPAQPSSGSPSSPAAPPGMRRWWGNSSSRSTAASRSRWTSPRSSATAIRSSTTGP